LSNRVKRDLLLVGSSSNAIAASSAIPPPGGKSKLEQAIKDLTVIIKLYDTVLQSLGQMRGLALVEEKEEVKRGVEGLEAYFRASRCYNLARLHTIHPTPSFASAIQLLSRSSDLAREASETLSAGDIELKEQVIVITDDKNIAPLRKRIEALESAAKRALFAERIDKPLFFDTAFNYIDLPMDELHRLGGKASTSTAEEPSAIPAPVKSVVEAAGRAVETVKAAAVDNGVRSRNREATPSVETESEKPKGWLGGWFGKK
jgi:signal recognition particle subunit SRP68